MADLEMQREFLAAKGEKPSRPKKQPTQLKRSGIKPVSDKQKTGSQMVAHVRKALRNRHATHPARIQEWCYFEELVIGSARHRRDVSQWFQRERPDSSIATDYDPTRAGQRIDGFAIARWTSAKARRIAYEIKVSRSDFLAELKDPDKRAAALACANEFYFVVPVGLIKPDEIPPECGLIEVMDNGRTRQKVKAPWNESEITSELLVAVARKAS